MEDDENGIKHRDNRVIYEIILGAILGPTIARLLTGSFVFMLRNDQTINRASQMGVWLMITSGIVIWLGTMGISYKLRWWSWGKRSIGFITIYITILSLATFLIAQALLVLMGK